MKVWTAYLLRSEGTFWLIEIDVRMRVIDAKLAEVSAENGWYKKVELTVHYLLSFPQIDV